MVEEDKSSSKAQEAPAPVEVPGRVAELTLTDKTRLVGIVSTFRGQLWGHLRKYVESKAYTGLTQSGVALRQEAWGALTKVLEIIPLGKELESETEPEKEWGRVEKSRTVSVVVRTLKDSGTAPGIKVDIREWVEGGKYTGWTKKGVRFGAEHLVELGPLHRAVSKALADQSESSDTKTGGGETGKQSDGETG